jgi:hypothetical protein
MMNSEEKASLYEAIVLEGDVIQRKISQLKSHNAGINMPVEVEDEIKVLKERLGQLEDRMNQLMMNP